jgi:predicted acetyltransferase
LEGAPKGTAKKNLYNYQIKNMTHLTLRQLKPSDEEAFLKAIAEFKEDDPDWEFAFHLDKISNFAEYVSLVNSWEKGENLEEGFVPNSYLVAVVENRIVGRTSIRHTLNEFLLNTYGHIGYGVIPSERGKGYAKKILAASLSYIKQFGVEKALVTCNENNIASMKTIKANGGVFGSKMQIEGERQLTCRYWIEIKGE